MGRLGEGFAAAAKEKLFKTGLSKGDIFLNKFEEVDHPKFFIVAGLADDKFLTCSVYINSEIHPSLYRKPELMALQVPVKKADYSFLKYDSYACCSTPLYIRSENIFKWKEAGSCKVIAHLTPADLEIITKAITGSGLLSQEEIELYFK